MNRGRPRKQYCVKGHDTFTHGRDGYGSCLLCKRERNDAREAARRKPSLTLDEVMRDVAEMRRRVEQRRAGRVPA